MLKRTIIILAVGLAVGAPGCAKQNDAPAGMTVTTDTSGTRRVESAPLPADAPPEARATASAAAAEAQHAAQQNAAMAKALREAQGRR